MASDQELKVTERLYAYTKISQLANGMNKVHIAGVIILFQTPKKARSITGEQNCYCTLRIIDESTDNRLTCTLFNKDITKLPKDCQTGDVIFLRRLFFKNNLLTGSRFSSWIYFGAESNDPVTPSDNSTVTDVERERARELKTWARENTAKIDQLCSVDAPNDHVTNAVPSKSRSYRYSGIPVTSLNTLTPQPDRVALCGVVQFFKLPTKSRGSDYFVTLGLLDKTCSISCTLFNPVKEKLLSDVPIGEVVLLKGARVTSYKDHFLVTCYKEAFIATSSSEDSLEDEDQSIMEELKEWSIQEGDLLLNTKLSQLDVNHFFNLICRVAAVYTSTIDNSIVLKVFDGTIGKLAFEKSVFAESEWSCDFDRQLVFEYSELLIEVEVVGLCEGVFIKPGQYINLVHVFAKLCSSGDQDQESTTRLVLSSKQNDGTIKILSGNESESVENYLKNFPKPYGPFPVYSQPSYDHTSGPLFSVGDEETKQVCTVQEALDCPLEKAVVVEGEIMCFCRGPIEELCQLRCTLCKTRYIPPHTSNPPLPANMDCVLCSKSKGEGPFVKFMFVFSMKLRDPTGTLEVCVTDKEGNNFLPQVQPVNLYAQESSRNDLLKLLYAITGGNDPFYLLSNELDFDRPSVKCGVRKFVSVNGESKYTLTDTVCQFIS